MFMLEIFLIKKITFAHIQILLCLINTHKILNMTLVCTTIIFLTMSQLEKRFNLNCHSIRLSLICLKHQSVNQNNDNNKARHKL